jgi:hypothetical protein
MADIRLFLKKRQKHGFTPIYSYIYISNKVAFDFFGGLLYVGKGSKGNPNVNMLHILKVYTIFILHANSTTLYSKMRQLFIIP